MIETEGPAPVSKTEDPAPASPITALIVPEFFFYFIGSLLPGLVFTIFAAPLILWAGYVTREVAFKSELISHHLDFKLAADFSLAHSPSDAQIVALALIVSYVIGSIFSRQDPKVVDRESVAFVLWKDWGDWNRTAVQPRDKMHLTAIRALDKVYKLRIEDGQRRLVVRFDKWRRWMKFADRRRWAARSVAQLEIWRRRHGFSTRRHRLARQIAQSEGGQFPYSHLFEYLETRGLVHLSKYIPWKGSDADIPKRSKMFINVLKIRLQFWNPRQCAEIVRNEAHIRMMTSLWYAAGLLQRCFAIVLLLLAADIVALHGLKAPALSVIVGLIAAVLMAAIWMKRVVLSFLHYQRLREIVYVLETAYVALKSGNAAIFDDL